MGKSEYQLSDKICGNSVELIPKRTFIDKEKQMTMLFKTDGSKQYSGFKAEYVRVNLNTLNSMGVGEIESLDPNASLNESNASGMFLLIKGFYSKILVIY